MNIDDLTIGQAREIARLFAAEMPQSQPSIDNGMVGKYVIVRCHDAGVLSGILESYAGRECVLREARQLWYWKPATGAFLEAVANYGLDQDSKLSVPARQHLTEDCQIIECTKIAEESIRGITDYEP